MTKHSLKKISANQIVHVWYQETAPGEEYLSAFRPIDDTDWELITETVPYEEHLMWTWQQRAMNYPNLTDLADALVHFHQGDKTVMEAYLAKCEEVKTQFPKPTAEGGEIVPPPFSWNGMINMLRAWLGL